MNMAYVFIKTNLVCFVLGFINEESLQHHKKVKHKGKKGVPKIIKRNFSCDICSITFTTKFHLKYHKIKSHKDIVNANDNETGKIYFGVNTL